MKTTTQILARHGWSGSILLLILFIISVYFDWDVLGFIFFVGLVLWLFMFRNPERIPLNENYAFVSPVDGIVRDIQRIDSNLVISIETRFFDVGVIRSPYDILEASHGEKKGLAISFGSKIHKSLLNAMMWFENNEYFTFRIEFYPVFFANSNIFVSSRLGLGDRIGYMKAGISKIIIPQDAKNAEIELKINIGDRIYASQSVIGYVNEI